MRRPESGHAYHYRSTRLANGGDLNRSTHHGDDHCVVEAWVQAYGLSAEQQNELWVRWRQGEALRSVAREVGAPVQHVRRYVRQTGGVRPQPCGRSGRQLSLREREEVSRGLAASWSVRRIAAELGRSHSTVSREVSRNGGRGTYRAHDADVAADVRARRPKVGKLRSEPRLLAAVLRGLELEWSPEQISHRLRVDHPHDPAMRVSHETIYLSLFVPARSPLSPRLTQRLRTGRAMRYPKVARQPSGRGRLRGMVPLHQRPAEADGRRVAGHWEGDRATRGRTG